MNGQHHIAHDGHAIHGIGTSAESARQDVKDRAGECPDWMQVQVATERLVQHVREHGGSPMDTDWTIHQDPDIADLVE